jgi:hypothetical protein
LVIDTEKDLAMGESAGIGRALRVPVFRNLLIADFVSDIGTFMQSVGAAWLMVSLHAGPGYVALIQLRLPFLTFYSHYLRVRLAISSTAAETMTGATVAAVRYVRNSPAILTVLVRTGIILFFSSSLFALLPSVARIVDDRAIGYGLLLGCFGVGAIGGALLIQGLRARFSTEMIVSAGAVILGTAIMAITRLHRLSTLALVILVSGAAWVLFISLINALVQNLAPDWVRARVLAIFTLVYMGSFALGSCCLGRGRPASECSVSSSLFWVDRQTPIDESP